MDEKGPHVKVIVTNRCYLGQHQIYALLQKEPTCGAPSYQQRN